MKRFHVHVAVNDLPRNIAFYSAIFGEEPTVVKTDYAKWMLDDPRVNFAISSRGQAPGVNHLGFQADDDAELEAIHANLQNADAAVTPEADAHCCYARSDKYWVTDPQGIAWESFRSLSSIPLFGNSTGEDAPAESSPASCGSGAASASSTKSAASTSSASCCAPSGADVAMPVEGASGCCAKAAA